MRLTGAVVRVLPQDHDFDMAQWGRLQRSKDLLRVDLVFLRLETLDEALPNLA